MLNEVKRAFHENKLAISISAAIFFISLILGYIFQPYLYGYFNPFVEQLTEDVSSGAITLTFRDIFLNNIQIIFQMFVYGMGFCLSALMLAFNGFFAGYYIACSDNLFFTLILIIPHAIFEFSSCILACASGFILFNFIYRFLKELWKQNDESLLKCLSNSFDASFDKLKQSLILFFIASVLMVIAGFVEVYLTIPIAELILSAIS